VILGGLQGEINVEGLPNYNFEQDITEEDFEMPQSELARILGDGNARVSVSKNLKDADYGRSYSAHVTVTLTSHQDEETLRKAHALADDLAQEFVQLSFAEAQALYMAHGLHKK
jgi:hypothetical protein